MEEIMQSNTFFIIPLTAAYGTICLMWFLLARLGWSWKPSAIAIPDKRWTELLWAIPTIIGVLVFGQLYTAGWLIPSATDVVLDRLSWVANNFIIYSPIFLNLYLRKQGTSTIFISHAGLGKKLIFGTVSTTLGILVFVGLRGEWERLTDIVLSTFSWHGLGNFPAIFFENIALAFLFVRLKWAVGTKWAIGVPSILFAVAHVPGSLAEGDPWGHILTFFFLTGGLTVFILYTAYRSRDIIWLGVAHFVMDVAIKAF